MGLYDNKHLVPQTTKSLYNNAEKDRQRQSTAYKKDVEHNRSQQDSIRRHQYRRNADDVNHQQSVMRQNAKKSSRAVTGSSNYYKNEEFTLNISYPGLALNTVQCLENKCSVFGVQSSVQI